MVLYVDETENDGVFIVAGLLTDNPEVVQVAYRRFKKRISNFNIPDKYKGRLYTEFKSTLLDHDYSRIKRRMLEEISNMDAQILYAAYQKKNPRLNQVQKEAVYIAMLSSVLSTLPEAAAVIFDRFGKTDFERNIIESVRTNKRVKEITPMDSQLEPGLQFVDNVCSVIRLHVSGKDVCSYYPIIENLITEV